ncbi:hypothetical protein IE53DRAFT_382583 [Violaceomyces palustris]|uniref:Uncharacterized protein n=1 Tax=Violaceomyces palustris TaxID=1673888 RepID=A0ACD0NM41_9BASI|nr:hypothetical protein IE53DRAFT_382583 [Violaceomyces palustris]
MRRSWKPDDRQSHLGWTTNGGANCGVKEVLDPQGGRITTTTTNYAHEGSVLFSTHQARMATLSQPVPVPRGSEQATMFNQQRSQSNFERDLSPTSPTGRRLRSSSRSSGGAPGLTCSLTILKAPTDHPISPHHSICKDPDQASQPTTPQRRPSRFATSFGSLATQSSSPKHQASHVNIHVLPDYGILLPFIKRPSEVEELLFDTPANLTLTHRLCRLFKADAQSPKRRGVSEEWDEVLELLIGIDRPILDDEDWLARLESLIKDRSEDLWANLYRCLGADSLAPSWSSQDLPARFDSWADESASEDEDASDDDESLTPPHHGAPVEIYALHELPRCFVHEPAGKISHTSAREDFEPGHERRGVPNHGLGALPAGDSQRGGNSPFPSECGFGGCLADIMEEPSRAEPGRPQLGRRRKSTNLSSFEHNKDEALENFMRSTAGRFAGLRLMAPGSHDVLDSCRHHHEIESEIGSASPRSRRVKFDDAGVQHPTFNRHRRLSLLIGTHAEVKSPSDAEEVSSPVSASRTYGPGNLDRDVDVKSQDRRTEDSARSAGPPPNRRLRSRTEIEPASHHGQRTKWDLLHHHAGGSLHLPPRRRAMSFARSFAELTLSDPVQPVEACMSKAELLPESSPSRTLGRRRKSNSVSAMSPATDGGDPSLGPSAVLGTVNDLGLLPDGRTRHPSAGARERAASIAAFRQGLESGATTALAESDRSSTAPSIPGLLPDGRTRHPSGSKGSKDLSDSIAAFRATMGLSPSPPHGNAKSAGEATSRASEQVEPNLKTCGREEKTSRAPSPPRHMIEIEKKRKLSGETTGLALGGGFSLAKSGANFKKPCQAAEQGASISSTSKFASSRHPLFEKFNYRVPPPVHRRPGGFVSLAQEYEAARRSRRGGSESLGSVFSFSSNAVATSPSSSITSASADDDGWFNRRESADRGGAGQQRTTPSPTRLVSPKPAKPSSFGASPKDPEFSFPKAASPEPKAQAVGKWESSAVTSANEAKRSSFSVSPSISCRFPALPYETIVFPISPNPAISRAKEFEKLLKSGRCDPILADVERTCGRAAREEIVSLLVGTERTKMPDEALLESVGSKLRLVDHARAREVGGKEQEQADTVLAEEDYKDRWEQFSRLCQALGVGEKEIGLAKRRCGPAFELCLSSPTA